MKEINKNTIKDFHDVKTKRELAKILGVEYKTLMYNLYKLTFDEKYEVFEIKKRNGKVRKIIAPISGLKFLQQNLSKILLEIHNVFQCIIIQKLKLCRGIYLILLIMKKSILDMMQ